jgi:hypothetical protein
MSAYKRRHVSREGYNAVNSTNIPIGSGSQSVLKESHAIFNQFPGNLRIYFCNGYFQVKIHVNLRNNVWLKIIEELWLSIYLFSGTVRIFN